MALANFFDKAAMAASQILKGYDRGHIEAALINQPISVVFDDSGITNEGLVSLDLLIRLLARLYPMLSIIDLTGGHSQVSKELSELALRINPDIELTSGLSAIAVVVGNSKVEADHVFYIGSDGWVCKFSTSQPLGSLNSTNPFGAGAAACFAASNVFKIVFSSYLGAVSLDSEFFLSLFSFDSTGVNDGPELHGLDLEETLLVGLGAIGNGSLWALGKLQGIKGKLIVIDHENVSLSNLQRYVMAEQGDRDHPKTDLAQKALQSTQFVIYPEKLKWAEYLQKRKDWNINRVCVALDSAEERINVQGALPYQIINAWTQKSDLGVSRHNNFINETCLACLYLPRLVKVHKSQEIAQNLKLPERYIRGFLANNVPINEELLTNICRINKIPEGAFDEYIGKPIELFYSEVVCGGVFMKLAPNDTNSHELSVPSAFESAFAGLLLSAELIINASKISRTNVANLTRFNMLKPLSNYIQDITGKSKNCLCNDNTWKDAYKAKWKNKSL